MSALLKPFHELDSKLVGGKDFSFISKDMK